MIRRTMTLALAGGLALCASLGASAQSPAPTPSPTLPPLPSASERAFIADASTYLGAAYPTPADALKAGFIQYEGDDETGAISYANRQWTSTDAHHPSQLWYDAKGRLIGADFSVPLSSTPPSLWGVDPTRWGTFHAHVHYGLVAADGTTTFGATGKKFAAAGGSIGNPTAEQLVAAGIAKSPSDVRFVFGFPAIWDLEIWLIPNPNGAFAEYNPNVHPTKPAGMSM